MARKKTSRSVSAPQAGEKPERILVGVRIEERLVKVMKGVSEMRDATFGELLEEIFMAAIEGGNAFADRNGKLSPEMKQAFISLKQVYGVDYTLEELHQYREK